MIQFRKQSFVGGMTQSVDSTRLDDMQYAIARNCRVRFDVPTPVTKALVIEKPVEQGVLQGVVGFANGILLFQAGEAYFKDLTPGAAGVWQKLPNFLMDRAVDRLYYVPLPSSSNSAVRVQGSEPSSRLILRNISDGSSAGLLVQDGINQPLFIEPTLGGGRVTQTWGQWQLTGSREYVPVGLNMMYSAGGILYILAPDQRRFFRSVTGRPMDFVIPVDDAGQKRQPIEVSDASSMAFSVTFDTVTAIVDAPSENETFFIGTKNSGAIVAPVRDEQIAPILYGEPLIFGRQGAISTGPLNQESACDLLGDTVFIDSEGLKSFNATVSLKVEGKNSTFSQQINSLFEGITQGVTAIGKFDNYTLFSLRTKFGQGILVFDDTRGIFVSFDQLTIQGTDDIVGEIKMFTTARVDRVNRVFAVTTDNQLLELYSRDAETDMAGIYVGDWTSGDAKVEIVPKILSLVFINCQQSGDVRVTSYVDQKFLKSSVHKLEAQSVPLSSAMPFGSSSVDQSKPVTIQLHDTRVGWRVGFWLEWNFKASLSSVALDCNTDTRVNKITVASQTWAAAKAGVPRVTSVSPVAGLVRTSVLTIQGANLDKVQSISIAGIEMATLELISPALLQVTISESNLSGILMLQADGVSVPTQFNLTVG